MKSASILIAMLPLISACGSEAKSNKDPSTDNFKAAINRYYENHCVFLSISSGHPVTLDISDVSGDDESALVAFGRKTRSYEIYTSVGLFEAEDGTIEKDGGLFSAEKQVVPVRTYTLSEKGKSLLTEQTKANGKSMKEGFCAANLEVSEIVNYTEPSEYGGFTISEVYYTVSPKTIADWANTDEVKNAWPSIAERMMENQKENDVVVLTNNGWIHEKDMAN